MSDATPYYFFGLPRAALPHEPASSSSCGSSTAGRRSASGTRRARAATCGTGGRARGSRSSTRSTSGQEAQGDPELAPPLLRQQRPAPLLPRGGSHVLRSLAFSLVGDVGYEHRGNAPSGAMGGVALTHRSTGPSGGRARCAATSSTTRRRPSRRSSPSAPPYPWPSTGPILGARHVGHARLLAEPVARHAPRVLAPRRRTSRSSAAPAGSPARAACSRAAPARQRRSCRISAPPTTGCCST